MCERYNGWRNWETWIVSLYLGDLYSEILLERVGERDLPSPEDLAAQIREHCESFPESIGLEIPSPSLLSEFWSGSLSSVDWRELAETWSIDAREEWIDLWGDPPPLDWGEEEE